MQFGGNDPGGKGGGRGGLPGNQEVAENGMGLAAGVTATGDQAGGWVTGGPTGIVTPEVVAPSWLAVVGAAVELVSAGSFGYGL
jgi:hypothetical protein